MTEFTTWRSLVDGAEISAIPDSEVSRPDDIDNASRTTDDFQGIKIETSVEWPEIGVEISSQTDNVSRVQVYRVNDEKLMGETTGLNLSGGDTAIIDLDDNLQEDTTYSIVGNNPDEDWTTGFTDSDPGFPFVSNDDNLSIVDGAINKTDSNVRARAFVTVGNVGFD